MTSGTTLRGTNSYEKEQGMRASQAIEDELSFRIQADVQAFNGDLQNATAWRGMATLLVSLNGV